MTDIDSIRFVEEVLQVGWPKWQFTERDKGEWARRLWPFDFDRAKKIILDFAFKYTKPGRPPTGQIFAILHKNAKLSKEQASSEPVMLYTIMRPDGVDSAGNLKSKPAGHPVGSARGVPADAEKIQEQAERLCRRLAGDREGYYILWLCEAVAPSMPF